MGLFVFLAVCWLGFAALAFVVARRVFPAEGRWRALVAGALLGALLAAPSWLSLFGVLWLQRGHVGRGHLGRFGVLFGDDHDGDAWVPVGAVVGGAS